MQTSCVLFSTESASTLSTVATRLSAETRHPNISHSDQRASYDDGYEPPLCCRCAESGREPALVRQLALPAVGTLRPQSDQRRLTGTAQVNDNTASVVVAEDDYLKCSCCGDATVQPYNQSNSPVMDDGYVPPTCCHYSSLERARIATAEAAVYSSVQQGIRRPNDVVFARRSNMRPGAESLAATEDEYLQCKCCGRSDAAPANDDAQTNNRHSMTSSAFDNYGYLCSVCCTN